MRQPIASNPVRRAAPRLLVALFLVGALGLPGWAIQAAHSGAQAEKGNAASTQWLIGEARTLLDQGKLAEAEARVREVLALHEGGAVERKAQAEATGLLGEILAREGRLAAAEKAYRDALSRTRQAWGEGHDRVAEATIELASSLDAQGKSKAVEHLYRLEIDVSRKSGDQGNTRVLSMAFAEWLLEVRRPADAELLARGGLDLGLKSLEAGDWRLGHARSVIGEALAAQRKFAKAETFLLEGQKDLTAASGAPDEARQKAIRRLVDLYEAWERASPGQGRIAEAARWKARL